MYLIFLKTAAIFVVIVFGYLLRRRELIDAAFNRQLSLVLVNLLYPALIFSSILRHFTPRTLLANWTLPAGAALIMLIGWGVGLAARPLLRRLPAATAGMFRFQCLMNNYSFLPIMLAALLLDETAVSRIIFSTIGAEFCLWTLGVQALTGRPISWRTLRNLRTLPMLAMSAGCALLLLRSLVTRHAPAVAALAAPIGNMLLDACKLAGQATIPMSAIVVGSRMAGLHPRHLLTPPMAAIVALRLLLIPALATALLLLLPLPASVRPVLLLVAVQPCAMASVTLAEVYAADAEFAAGSVLLTHLGCLLTIPLWLSAPWWQA